MNDRTAPRLTLFVLCMILFSILSITNIFAQTVGYPISGISNETMRANQSKVFWHDGYWWGLFHNSNEKRRAVYKFENGSWTEAYVFNTSLGTALYLDGFIDSQNDKLYVVDTRRSKFWRLDYDGSNGTWSTGVDNVTVTVNNSSDNVGCIVKANDGDIFIFTTDSGLKGWHSSDDGSNWTAFTIDGSLPGGLTDAVAFRYNNTDYVGILLAENSTPYDFRFYKLADSDSPTSSGNWNSETLNIGTDRADNHCSLIKDFDQNLYMIGKYTSGPTPLVLFERSSSTGNWTKYDVGVNFLPKGSGVDDILVEDGRPALSFDETNDKLYLFAQIGFFIKYATLDKGNLGNISNSNWSVVLQEGEDQFTDLSVSYQQLGSATDMMVLGSNNNSGEVWYNTIDLSFSASDPLIISEVNSTDNPDASYLEIYNTSGSVINLANYELRYYNNNSTSPTTQSLSGTILGYGYKVLAKNGSTYNSTYGGTADFTNSGFVFDGGKDGIALVNNNAGNLEKNGINKTNAVEVVDQFNDAGGEMESWSSGQLFERTRWPNDGSNIYLDYDRSRTTSAGTPGGTNDTSLPVLLSSFAATVENNRVNLQWATSAELDNFEWLIERRMNTDENFHEIGRMAGNGTTNERHEYDFLDAAVLEGNAYEYRLSNVDYSGQINQYPQIVRVNITAGSIEDFQLYANYPNPFNGETNIRFRIGEPTKTTLVVYDINGRVVKTIFSGELNQGEHIYRWDATDNLGNTVASGFYLVRLRTDNFYKSVKMILAR